MKLVTLLIFFILPALINTRPPTTVPSSSGHHDNSIQCRIVTDANFKKSIICGKTFKSVEDLKDHFGKQHHIDSIAIKDSAGKFFT